MLIIYNFCCCIIFFGALFNNCYGKPIKHQINKVTKVNCLRIWPSPDNVRVVLDLNKTPKYKIDNLYKPNRVIIKLIDAELNYKINLDLKIKKLLKNAHIKKIVTKQEKNDLLITLELQDLMTVNSFVLKPNERYSYRLVLDLESNEKQKILAFFDLDELSTNELSSFKREQINNKFIIAIDAGHGGEDPGAIGTMGTLEKDLVLSIAKILKKEINNSKNMEAFLIREGDYYISLKNRMLKARQKKADLLLSIHADAAPNSKVDGASVFILSKNRQSSGIAKWLAESQNRSDTIGGVQIREQDDMLASVLFDLSTTANFIVSSKIAKNILLSLKKTLPLHRSYVEQANFAVLQAPDVPSVLIETGFISNPNTEAKLKQYSYQKTIVTSIVKGIQNYFGHKRV